MHHGIYMGAQTYIMVVSARGWIGVASGFGVLVRALWASHTMRTIADINFCSQRDTRANRASGTLLSRGRRPIGPLMNENDWVRTTTRKMACQVLNGFSFSTYTLYIPDW